ncbi:hypothetical protein ALQ19_200157 [Pseudomonas syringae pv. berberidis]|nr:hypothetical protein ALQ19_200157 [Pseudomonas syringae pv. berberidis]
MNHIRVDDRSTVVGQGKQKRREGLFQGETNGLRIDDRNHHVLWKRTGWPLLESHQTIKGKLHGGGINYGTVIEFVARFYLKLPNEVIRRDSPALRQITLHVSTAFAALNLVSDQPLI